MSGISIRGKYAATVLTVLVSLAGVSVVRAADATGEQFIKEAIQGNLAEVKVGQLAQEKGASQGVKDFGATLAKDHAMANRHATQAAQQMNITPPDAPGVKQNALYAKLSVLSGETFDQQFIKSMVKDHEEDIAQYEQEARHGGPAADYAKQTLPKLRAHLKMAEDLQRGKPVAQAAQDSKTK